MKRCNEIQAGLTLLSTTGIFDQLKASKILSGPNNLGNQFVGTFPYFAERERIGDQA